MSWWDDRVIESGSKANLGSLMQNHIGTEAPVKRDYWAGYRGMKKELPNLVRKKSGKKEQNFGAMYHVIIMFKAWVRGTHHSVVALRPYINEYTYRFNWHMMKAGIFEHLVVRMLAQPPNT